MSAAVYGADTIALTLDSPLPSAGAFTLEYASEHGTALALSLPRGALKVSRGTGSPVPQASYEVVVAGDIQAQLAPPFNMASSTCATIRVRSTTSTASYAMYR